MRVHFISKATNIVVNTVEQPDLSCPFADQFAEAAATGSDIGQTWNGSGYIAPPAPPTPIPQSVTMRQARLALLAAGNLAAVQTAINGMPEPAKTQAQISWDYSSDIVRSNSFVTTLGAALGLNSSQIDALFIAASAL